MTAPRIGAAMSDEQLAKYLALPVHLIPKMKPEQRAAYEHMANVEMELSLWMQGLGPRPAGVMVDTERSTRNRKAWR